MSGTCLPAYCAYRMQGRATVNFAESQTLDPVPSIPGTCVGQVETHQDFQAPRVE